MFKSLEIKPSEVDLVIYHGRCSDGFTSALASYCYFKNTNGTNINGNVVQYFGASFNQMPPDVTGKNVLICDFSYKKNILTDMISKAKSLAVIDHHESAEIELQQIPDKYKVFDMTHSGAYLTWKFFYPDQDVPLFVKYVEDNDIWIKKMPMTEEITSYTYSMPFKFEEYEKMLDDNFIENVAKPVGQGMKRQNDIYVKEGLRYCTQRFIQIGEEYYIVAYINSTVLRSELGNKSLTEYPYCDFSAIFSVNGDQTTFSLRSNNDKVNVSQISTKFGGGGHRNASGMSVYNSVLLPVYHVDNGQMAKLLESDFITIVKSESNNDLTVATAISGSANPVLLGKYLMQTYQEKISNTETRSIQKCCSIWRTKTNNPSYCDSINILIITSNKTENIVEQNIFFNNDELFEKYKNIFSNQSDTNYFEFEKRIRITMEQSNQNNLNNLNNFINLIL